MRSGFLHTRARNTHSHDTHFHIEQRNEETEADIWLSTCSALRSFLLSTSVLESWRATEQLLEDIQTSSPLHRRRSVIRSANDLPVPLLRTSVPSLVIDTARKYHASSYLLLARMPLRAGRPLRRRIVGFTLSFRYHW